MIETLLITIHVACLCVGGYALLRRNDEIPLLIAFAVTYFGFYRYTAIALGWAGVVQTGGLYNLAAITNEELLSALALMTVGEAVLITVYLTVRSHTMPLLGYSEAERAISARACGTVLKYGWIVLAAAFVAQLYLSAAYSSGAAIAFGYGYATHISFLRIGVALLLFQLFLAGGIRTSNQHYAWLAFFGFLVVQSFGPAQRYQFLGWALGVAMLWSYRSVGATRVRRLAAGGLVVLLAVGAAGALRGQLEESGDLAESAVDRLLTAEDANMLDGLALLTKVFPELVPYRYGGAHLEVLYRPIPRAIWPDKPKGSYIFAIASSDVDFESRGTTGFSPSLFGSFYAEGGVIAVVILCAVYGLGLAMLINWANRHGLLISGLVRASTAAALIPLLRGGDLAGNFAWIGFGFIAVGLFVYVVKTRFPRAVLAFGSTSRAL